jgi:type II secretory pathway component PulF
VPVFSYRALAAGGRTVTGEIPAESDRHARALLRESGYRPIHLAEVSRGRVKNPTLGWTAAFTRQLGTLLRAGFPMDRALTALASSTSDDATRAVLTSVDEQVRGGATLSRSIGKAWGNSSGQDGTPKRGSGASGAGDGAEELVAMVEAGEASGDLAEVLLGYADLLDRRIAFRRRLRGALFYPLIVAGLSLLVVAFLFLYVVPTITRLFEGSSMPLPFPTRVLFLVSDILSVGFLPAVLVAIPAIWLFRRFARTTRGRRRIEEILHSLPGWGRILEKASFARWARGFAALIKHGVEILTALEIAGRTSLSARIQAATVAARPRVAEGVPLAKALSETGIFPALAIEAVMIGESSGTLPQVLGDMAIAWEGEVESAAERFADLLEPLVLVVMGVVVGGIVLAVLLPIFEFNAGVR